MYVREIPCASQGMLIRPSPIIFFVDLLISRLGRGERVGNFSFLCPSSLPFRSRESGGLSENFLAQACDFRHDQFGKSASYLILPTLSEVGKAKVYHRISRCKLDVKTYSIRKTSFLSHSSLPFRVGKADVRQRVPTCKLAML